MKTGLFRLCEDDRPALTQHLLRLNREDRRLRFFQAVDDAHITRFVQSLEMARLQGFFLHNELVGSAMTMSDGNNTVEFAVTVDEQLRGNGIASELLAYSIDAANDDDVDRLVIHHLLENSAMAAVHRKHPSKRRLESGEVDVVIDLKALRQERQKAFELLCAAEA